MLISLTKIVNIIYNYNKRWLTIMDYTSQKTDQLQKRYDMLLKSVVFSNSEERKNIYYELDKIETGILSSTEFLYNQEYEDLFNVKTSLLKEEKERLVSLIDLIENRCRYVSNEVIRHRANVNKDFEMPTVLGEDKIGEFQRKIKIIDKYNQNSRLKNKLVKEIEVLKDKITKSEAKIRSNERINKELETKMIDMLEKSFKAMEIYSYKEREDEINLAFDELAFAKEKAFQNIENARSSNNVSLLSECEKLYDSVDEEFHKYYEKKMLLKLLSMYDRVVNNYDELLFKRNEINDILSQIDSSDFYKLVFNEVNKQYTTIRLEQQDLKTFKALSDELNTKERLLNEIEKENSSEEFTNVLDELLKNEKIKQEKEDQERRRLEYEERQKRLIEESKKQEEIRKKQRKIEEERKRDIEIRTREMLKKQKPKEEVKEEIEKKEKPEPKKIENTDTMEFFPVKEVKDIKEVVVNNNNNNVEKEKEVVVKEKEEKIQKENKYNSILKDDTDFGIPVIKNDKLVAKKVKEEKTSENDVNEFMKRFLDDSKKEEAEDVSDMVFPDMPM